jgi:hypothetical protein
MLSDARKSSLERFAMKPERKPGFERYPALMDRVERRARAWVQEKTGGNFVLALKNIYEDELLRCFHRTCVLMRSEPTISRKKMQEAVSTWKKANEGSDINLEVLWAIMPDIMRPLTLGTVTATPLTRHAEAATEELLKRDAVVLELEHNPALKKQFLHDVRAWIALGAHSANPAFAIQQIYHDALILQYEEGLKKRGADPVQPGQIRFAALKWFEENEEAVLTTAILDRILDGIKKGQ